MTGSAASKKQPTFEQFSPANIFTLHWRNDPVGRSPKRPAHTGLELKGCKRGLNFLDCRGLFQRARLVPFSTRWPIEILNIS